MAATSFCMSDVQNLADVRSGGRVRTCDTVVPFPAFCLTIAPGRGFEPLLSWTKTSCVTKLHYPGRFSMPSVLNDDEQIRRAAQLPSTREALEFLGLRPAGGNYSAFKRACARVGVEQPLGTGMHQVLTAIASTKIPLEDILVEDSTYTNRSNIKRRCIEAGLLEDHCYGHGCEVGTDWLGSPLTLQLEHKNGVSNDHRIENLELLCPNCHSQTATYCGRRKPRICVQCGAVKQTTSPLCRSCAARKSHPR